MGLIQPAAGNSIIACIVAPPVESCIPQLSRKERDAMNRALTPSRRAFSVIELLTLIACGVLLLVLVYPSYSSQPVRDRSRLCSTRLSQMHKGLVLFANDFGGQFPIPNKISAKTAAANSQSGNSTANVISYMIFNTYYSPEITVCPDEANPNVVVKKDYRYGTMDDKDWNDYWLWDPNFSADITKPGANVSYAMLALLGARRTAEWCDSLNGKFVVLADRGPKDGAFNADSQTNKRHGDASDWTGNVMFNDGHSQKLTFNAESEKLFEVNGDNLFRVDDLEKGGDMWLGLFGATDEKTTTPYWD
ncbi:MAG: hypothetical protein IT430_15085 [Phycisphaerales bacterium]|nr:hypothetical protein [Phycisphaerales bacterium]